MRSMRLPTAPPQTSAERDRAQEIARPRRAVEPAENHQRAPTVSTMKIQREYAPDVQPERRARDCTRA